MVETNDGKCRTQFAEGRDGHSLSSSGRWTDAKLHSSKKNATERAAQLASGFNKKEKAKPFVRIVTIEDDTAAKPIKKPAKRTVPKKNK